MSPDQKDYGADGIDLQTAMVRHVRAHPDRPTGAASRNANV